MLNWIHGYRNGFLDTFFRNITHAGSVYFVLSVTVVLVLFLMHSEKYSETKMLLTSVVATIVLSHVAKLFFKRPRPDIHPPIIPMPLDWSFPSAHTAQITALSLGVCILAFRYLPGMSTWIVCALAMAMICLVGFSRMYLQVHHPTDVVAGFVLAAVVTVLSHLLYKT
jgi:undecaprenyl-diphosphatase